MKKGDLTEIYVNGIKYNVNLNLKLSRSRISVRYKSGTFYVNATYFTSLNSIKKLIYKFDFKKIEALNPFKENGIYVFGEFEYFNNEYFKINDKYILFKSKEEFYKDVKKIVKPIYEKRLRYYENIMNIERPYTLKIRDANSRYGSNSLSTHSIMLSIGLMHYSIEIIDSVIVHELAHDKYRNHKKEFYDEINKYMQNYKILERKLKKGIYK